MASNRLTIRIPEHLEQRLRRRTAATGRSESELVREALEAYLASAPRPRSAYEVAEELGLIGCVLKAPKDLSTNRRHLKSFGKSR